MSPAKTAEPVEMPFGFRTQVEPDTRNHVLDGPDPPWETVIWRGEGVARCKVQGRSAASCAKTAKQIEMLFGLLARMG